MSHKMHDQISFMNEDENLMNVVVQYEWRPNVCE